MEIRTIRPDDDRLALSGVCEAGWRWAYRGIVPQAFLDALPAGRWRDFFDAPGVYTLVAVDGSVYAGTASFGLSRFAEYGGSGEVISLYLRPEYTGRGWAVRCLRLRWTRLMLWVLTKFFSGYWRRTPGREPFTSAPDSSVAAMRLTMR